MQQIRNSMQNKKTTIHDRLRICKLAMVRPVDKRWNFFYADIVRLYDGLKEMGVNPG